jgi:hypothetical protein
MNHVDREVGSIIEDVIKKIRPPCPHCDGTGAMGCYPNGEDDFDLVPCEYCDTKGYIIR